MVPHLLPSVTVCVLFFGDHAPLARQFLEAWKRYGAGLPLRIGLNACSTTTRTLVEEHLAQSPGSTVICSEVNLGKSGMMRRLLREPHAPNEWVIWFDDDSFPFRADWLISLGVAMVADPRVVMFGVPAAIPADERLVRLVTSARWYRGRPLLPPLTPDSVARLEFILGGFWALKAECLTALDWPDERLVQFEEDYLLGEAIRQRGETIGSCHSGVRIDTAPRRAPTELPRHCG